MTGKQDLTAPKLTVSTARFLEIIHAQSAIL